MWSSIMCILCIRIGVTQFPIHPIHAIHLLKLFVWIRNAGSFVAAKKCAKNQYKYSQQFRDTLCVGAFIDSWCMHSKLYCDSYLLKICTICKTIWSITRNMFLYICNWNHLLLLLVFRLLFDIFDLFDHIIIDLRCNCIVRLSNRSTLNVVSSLPTCFLLLAAVIAFYVQNFSKITQRSLRSLLNLQDHSLISHRSQNKGTWGYMNRDWKNLLVQPTSFQRTEQLPHNRRCLQNRQDQPRSLWSQVKFDKSKKKTAVFLVSNSAKFSSLFSKGGASHCYLIFVSARFCR